MLIKLFSIRNINIYIFFSKANEYLKLINVCELVLTFMFNTITTKYVVKFIECTKASNCLLYTDIEKCILYSICN